MAKAHLTFAQPSRNGTALALVESPTIVVLDTAGTARDTGDRAGQWVRIDVDEDAWIYFGSADATPAEANSLKIYAGQPETFEIQTADQRLKIGAA